MKPAAVFITVLLFTFGTHSSNAQDHSAHTSFRINPLGAVASSIPVGVEHFFGTRHFSGVAAGFITRSRSGSGESTYNNDGFAFSPEFRYYFSNNASVTARTYAGVWLNYEEHSNSTLDRLGVTAHGNAFGRGGGFLIGNQWFFSNGFLVDFTIGPGYMKYETSEVYDLNISKGGFLTSLTGPKNSGTKIRFSFAVGLAI